MPAAPPARVLVVEDDDDVRAIYGELLESEGYEVDCAATRDEARTLLSTRDYALVISDAAASARSPWDALEELQRLAAPGKVGLISGFKLDSAEAERRGFAFSLRKPLHVEGLLGHVAQHAAPTAAAPPIQQLARDYYAALSEKNWTALGGLVTDDVRYNLPGEDPTFSRVIEGRDAFLAFSEETFRSFADATFEVEAVLTLPRGVVTRFRSRWTAPDNTRAELQGSVLFRLVDDKIAEIGVRLPMTELKARINGSIPATT